MEKETWKNKMRKDRGKKWGNFIGNEGENQKWNKGFEKTNKRRMRKRRREQGT